MFGFVLANEQDLSEDEKARYRHVYCGICEALHRQSGQLSRLTLNNDLTFLALLHISLYEPQETAGEMRCLMHPIERRAYVANECIDYAADMTVMLAYHKLMDNWVDDRHVPSRAFAQGLKSAYRAIAQRHPRQCEATETGLARITEMERSWCVGSAVESPDDPANEFGRILAETFVVHDDIWAPALRALGFELGRFIYLMDAAMDLQRDLEKGSYNPFVGHDFSLEEQRMLLGTYMARATDVFERLPLVLDAHLLRSVMYAGVWQRFNERMLAQEREESGEMIERDDNSSNGFDDDNQQNDAAVVEMGHSSVRNDEARCIIQEDYLRKGDEAKEPARGHESL